MERDRAAALSYFLRFLAGNPDGDAATRALALGAAAPLDVVSVQIYASRNDVDLELVGNYGVPDDGVAAYRLIPLTMPLPICEAFASLQTVVVEHGRLTADYPIMETDPSIVDGSAAPYLQGSIVCLPVILSGVPIGVLTLLTQAPADWSADTWQYLDGVSAGVAMWMNNQRETLVDRWRRQAPAPSRQVRITERQRSILEMVARDLTNTEIAHKLGYSVPTVKKDLQQLMNLLGTHERRMTAGRAREVGLLPERRARVD